LGDAKNRNRHAENNRDASYHAVIVT
jgi:hypothetical protein